MTGNTALHKKMQLDKYARRLVLNKPADLTELDGAAFDVQAQGRYNMVLHFVYDLEEMERAIRGAASADLLEEGGMLFIAYPKKGNKRYGAYIGRDSIMPHLGVDDSDGIVPGTPFAFCRMLALNDTFTVVGLRNGRRVG